MLSKKLYFYGYRFSAYATFLTNIKNLQKLLETKSCVITRTPKPTNLT